MHARAHVRRSEADLYIRAGGSLRALRSRKIVPDSRRMPRRRSAPGRTTRLLDDADPPAAVAALPLQMRILQECKPSRAVAAEIGARVAVSGSRSAESRSGNGLKRERAQAGTGSSWNRLGTGLSGNRQGVCC